MADRYRFGGLEFDTASGEILPADPARGEARPRLPRQPARLLALLAERAGEVVTREEIREHIWTDTAVEFDASLHFCIRQIRAALGDQASAPRFVETIPRQGYRLIPQVERVSTGGARATQDRSRASLTRRVAVGALLVGAFAVASYVGLRDHAAPAPPPVRIGILPFRPPADWRFGEVPPIAEWILEELTSLAGDRVELVGPTTTASFEESGIRLLAEQYDLSYVVNGRFLSDGETPAMLGELIRTADGAHVWVRRFVDLGDGKGIGVEIGRGVEEQLGLSPTSIAPTGALSPPHRMHHALAYDPASRRVIMYGGAHRVSASEQEVLDDLWSWDGRVWAPVALHSGVEMAGHRLFADGTGGVFSVGGSVGGARGATARWDGASWLTIAEDSSISRSGAAGAYDSRRKRFVLYGGGSSESLAPTDTWEFDGSGWTRVATSGPPTVRGAAMAYDERRGAMVLFGGRAAAETWEWNGQVWARVGTTGPSPRTLFGMAYDSKRNEVVLFGGADSTGRCGDTWIWNGQAWRQADVAGPSPRAEPFMAFDAARGVTVMFGGFGRSSPPSLGDTWEWDGARWSMRNPHSGGRL